MASPCVGQDERSMVRLLLLEQTMGRLAQPRRDLLLHFHPLPARMPANHSFRSAASGWREHSRTSSDTSCRAGVGIRCEKWPASRLKNWLRSLALANATKAKLRNLMSAVFRHAIRYGWLGQYENPIALVRVSAKRKCVPATVTAEEFRGL